MELVVAGDPVHEMLLAKAWVEIFNCGDVEKVWFPKGLGLGDALQNWLNSTVFMSCDGEGIWALSWFQPFADQGLWSIWIRPSKRKSLKAGRFAVECLKRGSEIFPSVITMTNQPSLLKLWKKLGFTLSGLIKVDGKPTWIAQRLET